jgi:SAM-dependent methyltransferase
MKAVDDACSAVMRDLPDDPSLAEWVRSYVRYHRYRLAEDLQIVSGVAATDWQVGEFGSAPYLATIALKQSGYRVQGFDIAPERFSRLLSAHGLTVHKADFETQPVPVEDDTFDLVLFNEVFEHLRIDLIRTMSEVRRVLKPSGLLLLSTPNLRSLVGLWTLLWRHRGCHIGSGIYGEYEKLSQHGHMGHVREYTAREVSEFLACLGLETVEVIFRFRGPAVNRGIMPRFLCFVDRCVGTVHPGMRSLFTLVCRKAM